MSYSSGDFLTKVAFGQVPGYSSVTVIGRNEDIDVGGRETLWDQGGVYEHMDIDTTLYLTSSDNGDVGQVIVVTGLETWNQKTGVFLTNGQTPVNIGAWNSAIFSVTNIAPVNLAGDLYLSSDSGDITNGVPNTSSNIKAKIIAGRNVTQMGLWSIPIGYTAVALTVNTYLGKNKDARFIFTLRPFGGSWLESIDIGAFQNYGTATTRVGFSVPAQSEIKLAADTTSNNTDATVLATFILKQNGV